MKVVFIGPGEVEGRSGPVWEVVRAALATLGHGDELVHTDHGVGRMIDSIARRAKGAERRRLPKIEVEPPEIGRYTRAEAFHRNAAQLLHYHAPHVLVYSGDGVDEEVAPVLELAPLYTHVVVQAVEEFVKARR